MSSCLLDLWLLLSELFFSVSRSSFAGFELLSSPLPDDFDELSDLLLLLDLDSGLPDLELSPLLLSGLLVLEPSPLLPSGLPDLEPSPLLLSGLPDLEPSPLLPSGLLDFEPSPLLPSDLRLDELLLLSCLGLAKLAARPASPMGFAAVPLPSLGVTMA